MQNAEFAVVFKLRPNQVVIEHFKCYDSLLDDVSCVDLSEIPVAYGPEVSDDQKREVSLGKVEDQAVGERYQDRIAANSTF